MDRRNDEETEQANRKLNEELDDGREPADVLDENNLTETEQANLEINERLDATDQDRTTSPKTYMYNNTPAIDVTKKQPKK